MDNQDNITKDDFLKFAEKHELEMKKIIVRYEVIYKHHSNLFQL